MVAFWKRFLWLLAVNAVINSELCVEVPLALPKLFLRGVKTTLFRPPSKYYNSHWPTNLEYFTNRRVCESLLCKSETRDHTRSTYSEDLLEQSSMTNFLKKATRGPKMSVVRNSTHSGRFFPKRSSESVSLSVYSWNVRAKNNQTRV